MQELLKEEAEFLKYNTLSSAADFNKFVSNSDTELKKQASSERDYNKYVGSPQIVSAR